MEANPTFVVVSNYISGNCHKDHFCHDNSFATNMSVATNMCLSRQNTSFVVTKVRQYFWQTRVCCNKSLAQQARFCSDKRRVFCSDKHVFVATKLLLRQKWYLRQLPPMINNNHGDLISCCQWQRGPTHLSVVNDSAVDGLVALLSLLKLLLGDDKLMHIERAFRSADHLHAAIAYSYVAS